MLHAEYRDALLAKVLSRDVKIHNLSNNLRLGQLGEIGILPVTMRLLFVDTDIQTAIRSI
ncbi:hypothetical protein GCM10025791_22430 [Halioxenophilus aromaticivorans]|uniref:DUF2007 domain-containing protein n=1 Tax=Halioxenophilus aromaticivorans TaxID=1306992 RepID=A0AAV3U315_9ALTE